MKIKITKDPAMSFEQFEKLFLEKVIEPNRYARFVKAYNKLDTFNKSNTIRQFWIADCAIKRNWDIYLICDKAPKDLDSGRHYFSMWTKALADNGMLYDHHIWFVEEVAKELGCWNLGGTRNTPFAFEFYSKAIGMSRTLDATDYFFNIVREVTGSYIQLTSWR